MFALQLDAADPERLINAFAANPYDIVNNIVLPAPSPPLPALTIVTSLFLHASALHVGFNMLFLFVFGPAIETLFGHLRFFAFYLVCGIVAGLAEVLVGPGSHVPAIGASGAIAGVLGAYLITYPTARILPHVPAIVIIGVWAASQFIHGYGALTTNVASEQGGTAYFAHIGGFAAGVLTLGLFRRRNAGTHVRPF